MDSITQLQGKLTEANNLLQYVSKELDGYTIHSDNSKINFSELKMRGEQYGFYEHPLKKCDFQDEYMTLLVSLLVSGGKEEEGWTVLYQIATGADYKNNLPLLVKDAQTLTEERFAEILRMISSCNLSRTFAIDSLLLCHRMGADDAQLKLLAGIFELLKLDVEFLKEAMSFVQTLDSTLWENYADKSKAWKLLTAQDIATYIGGVAVHSMQEAMEMNYPRIVISDIVHSDKNILLLDTWKAKEVLFLRCKFTKMGGIFSQERHIIFIDCIFDGNTPHYADDHSRSYGSNYVWTYKQYSTYRHFIMIKNSCFTRCTFKNYNDAVPMMNLDECLIYSCAVENCHQSSYSNMLLNIRNSNIASTIFKKCSSFGSWVPRGYSCMIYSYNTNWQKNTFDSCQSTGQKGGGTYGGFCCFIFLDEHSMMESCQLTNINISWTGTFTEKGSSYTLIICNSEEKDNKGMDSVGNMSYVPSELFFVVNKS